MIFKRVKKIFSSAKRPSRKNFWKIGLFLVFVIGMMNVKIQVEDNNLAESNNKNIVISFKLTNEVMASVNWENTINDFLINVGNTADWASSKISINNLLAGTTEKAFGAVFNFLLLSVSTVIGWFVMVAANIFDWVIRPESFDAVIKNNSAVYIAWAMVRDFLNLFFMLALLFSAFSTIFQVEKYHLKKIIILLVVMALLVNFSYPITLFVIDFSNSIMYFLVNLIPHSSVNPSQSALVAEMAKMGTLSNIIEGQTGTVALITTIIFQFILFVTLFAFAINLLIRILAFAILLIFAPAGFAFSFFPSTSNIADSWWNSLIKYAVLGPLMIFFLLIANLMFTATEVNLEKATFLSSTLMFTLPIVFLWMGLIASNKFGGDASATAMGIAKNTGNWVKNKGGRMAYRGVDTVSGHRISGGIGAIKRGWDRMDENYKSKSSAKAAKYAERIGVTGAEEQNMVNQANEYKKKGLTENTLKSMASSGDASAAYLLAENKKMDGDTYTKFMEKSKNEKVRKSINGKVKQSRIDLVAIQKANDNKEIDNAITTNGWSSTSATDRNRAKNYIIEQEIGGLDSEKYAQQDWKKVAEHVSILNESEREEEASVLKSAVSNAFNNMARKAQDSVKTKLSGTKAAELRENFGIEIV